jgi:hypothetical protein
MLFWAILFVLIAFGMAVFAMGMDAPPTRQRARPVRGSLAGRPVPMPDLS